MWRKKKGLLMPAFRQRGFLPMAAEDLNQSFCYWSQLIHCHHNLTSTERWAPITTRLELFVYSAISLLRAWQSGGLNVIEHTTYLGGEEIFLILSQRGCGCVLFCYCGCPHLARWKCTNFWIRSGCLVSINDSFHSHELLRYRVYDGKK